MFKPQLLAAVRGGIYSRATETSLSKRKKGFTLIELLVVIAIIALLVSILLPSLKRAKDLAMNVVCKTNLRGIGMSSALYRNDFDDMFPFTIPATYPTTSDPGEYVVIATWMTGGIGGSGSEVVPGYLSVMNTPTEDRIMYSYADDPNIWKCPSDHWAFWGNCAPSGVDETWRYYGTSYGFNTGNGAARPGLGLHGRSGADVSLPTATIQYGEYVVNNFYGTGVPSSNGPILWHDTEEPWANIVFVDGHVDYVLMQAGDPEFLEADDGSYTFFASDL